MGYGLFHFTIYFNVYCSRLLFLFVSKYFKSILVVKEKLHFCNIISNYYCSNIIKLLQQFLPFKKNITWEISVVSNKIYQCSNVQKFYCNRRKITISYLYGHVPFMLELRKWIVKSFCIKISIGKYQVNLTLQITN